MMVRVAFGRRPARCVRRGRACRAGRPRPRRRSRSRPRHAKFDSARAWAHLERQVQFGPRPAGSPALAETRRYLIAELKAAGPDRPRAGLRGQDAGRRRADGERDRYHPRPPCRPDRPGQPLRHQAGAELPLRRRQRRRVVHGRRCWSWGVRCKDSRPEFTIELLFLDGEEAVNWDWAGTDNTYGSRHYVSAGQADGTLKSAEGADPARHDRRQRAW